MPRNFQLISAVSGQHFYLGATGVDMYMPAAIALLSGSTKPMAYLGDEDDNEPKYHQKFKSAVPFIEEADYYQYYPVRLENGVVVFPIQGVIMQYDYCGRPGTQTYARWIRQAWADPSVKGVFAPVNTPGGAVIGTSEFGKAIMEANKPAIALNEGYACSGGQWVISAFPKAYATSENCFFGSIGVMTSYASFQKYYEKEGIIMQDVYSKTSPGKNFPSREAAKGNFKPLEEGVLYTLDQTFMNYMKERRPSISKEALDGFEYLTSEAIENGLCDGIATMDECVEMILSASGSTSKKSNSVTPQNSNTPMSKIKATCISILASMGALQIFKADNSEKNEEELVTDLQAQFASLSAENKRLSPFEGQVTTLQEQLTAMTKERDDYKQKAETAEQQATNSPAGKPTVTTQPVEDPTPEASSDGLPAFV